jgi:glucose-6-phosphate 1-dehydrogenase
MGSRFCRSRRSLFSGMPGPLSRQEPGSEMRPYDRLIGAALDGNRRDFARQYAVDAAWRVVDPVLGDVVPVLTYTRGSWAPGEAD